MNSTSFNKQCIPYPDYCDKMYHYVMEGERYQVCTESCPSTLPYINDK